MKARIERAVVINLRQRPERLQAFRARMQEVWPELEVRRHAAVDGHGGSKPSWFHSKSGAWGCLQSHRQVLASALEERVDGLLVFEDDALPVDGFREQVALCLGELPARWHGLWLGYQNLLPPLSATEHLYRVGRALRAHCYVLSAIGLRRCYDQIMWESRHVDQIFADMHACYPFYQPKEPLVAQRAGFTSDIDGKERAFDRLRTEDYD